MIMIKLDQNMNYMSKLELDVETIHDWFEIIPGAYKKLKDSGDYSVPIIFHSSRENKLVLTLLILPSYTAETVVPYGLFLAKRVSLEGSKHSFISGIFKAS